MELPSKLAKDLRYRAYFWLMNVGTVGTAIGVVNTLASAFYDMGVTDLVPSPWVLLIGIPMSVLNFFVPTLLVVARFMRDDYAEGLWRRAMLVVGHGVALGPIVLLAISWMLFFAVGPETPPWLHFLIEPYDPLGVLLYVWEVHLVLFVFAFQFLRWRDSR